MNGTHQDLHRDRGAEYKAIADALKNGLENEGFDVIHKDAPRPAARVGEGSRPPYND